MSERRRSYLPPSRHSGDQYSGLVVRRVGYIRVAYKDARAWASSMGAPSLFATNQVDWRP